MITRPRLTRLSTRHPAACAVLLLALCLPGCGAEEPGTAASATAASAKATGVFSASVDGKDVSIDYANGKLVTEIVHKINPDATGYGCVTTVFLSLAKADGSCALELTFQPGAGDGLALSSASFFASKGTKQGGVVIDTLVCDGFPGADKGGEVVWKLGGGDSNLLIAPVQPGESSKVLATLKAQDLKLNRKIKLKNGGKLFEVDLGKLRVQGDLKSTGSTQVSCGSVTGSAVCPKGVTYGNKVGEYVRQPLGAYRCDDDSLYDTSELCGSSAQIVVAYQHWVTLKDNWGGKDVIAGLGKTVDNHKDLGVVFVVLSGKEKIVVETSPGKFEAKGPAPTQAECLEIKQLYNIPDSVVMVYNKDKSLVNTGNQPVGVNFTPAVAVAAGDGKILSLLPGADGKLEQAAFDKAVADAIDAN